MQINSESLSDLKMEQMFVIKRNGEKQVMLFDNITRRNQKLANDLNIDDWHSLLYPKVNKAKNQKNDPGQITQNTSNADEGGLTAFTARVANPIALNRLWPNLQLT